MMISTLIQSFGQGILTTLPITMCIINKKLSTDIKITI